MGPPCFFDEVGDLGNIAQRLQVAVGRVGVAAGSLEEAARKLGGVVKQLLKKSFIGHERRIERVPAPGAREAGAGVRGK